MVAGETETTQDWLEMDEREPGFQLLTQEEIAAIIFIIYFYHNDFIKFSFYFSKLLYLLGLHFASFFLISVNPDDLFQPPINSD
jgi:hypothetical protein